MRLVYGKIMAALVCIVVSAKDTNGNSIFSPVAMCHRITDDFSDLFIAAASSSGLEMSPECVNSVNICSKVGSSDRIKISNINMQLNVAVELDKKMVEYTINSARLPSTSSNSNAFTVLMNKSKVYIMPKKYEVNTSSKVKKLSGPQQLYCDLIDWAQSTGCGWPSNIVEDSGKQALKSLSNALWYVDHCHARLKDASCHVPTELNKFQNYNSYKLLRHRPPIVKAARLGELVGDLYSALSLPSLSDKRNTVLAKIMGELAESLKQYKDRLENDNQKHQNISHKRETANCGDSNSVCIDPVTPSNVKEEYSHLNQTVVKTSDYTYVHLDKFCPDNRIERRKFIKNLRLSKPIMLYRVAYGGSIGTLNFIWSVPVGQTEDKTSRNMKVISQISEDLPTFSSRAMRQEFIDKFISYVKCPKSVIRHMYFSLTGHEESANSSSEKEINERVSKIIGADDSQLLIDLRATNGSDTYYDAFFEEMGKFFEEQVLQVSERRKCDEMYLPLAISIETLKNDICKRVPDGTPIPSNETIRLQFCPSNPFHKTALRYTGQFNVKFRVQTRQARVSHPDSHYAAKYFQYMKEFCVMFRDSAMFLCMDDKAIVPVGEPGIPISTGVRGHNKVLTPSEGPVLVATDHDFHLCGLVPSVVLVTEIPRDSKDSFFSGDMHVTTKEKVFSPSSPFRHAAEVIELVRLNDAYSSDGLNLRTPIMCLYTDGGPDHRVTYETVKLSLTLIFMHLDLDMLIALRTAPSHSWTNPAERCMSILNLALQHVALDRNEMEEKYEQMVKNLSSLTAVRNQARLKDGLKEAFKKSMEPVVDLVNKRFSQMSLKGNPVKTLKGVSDEEITSILDITGVGFGADSPVATADTKSAELKKSKHLQVKQTKFIF